jgi:hypothetical protein
VYFSSQLLNERIACLKNGSMHRISGTHHVHMDKPEQVAGFINSFWDKL